MKFMRELKYNEPNYLPNLCTFFDNCISLRYKRINYRSQNLLLHKMFRQF
jgi:hypothetical protein